MAHIEPTENSQRLVIKPITHRRPPLDLAAVALEESIVTAIPATVRLIDGRKCRDRKQKCHSRFEVQHIVDFERYW